MSIRIDSHLCSSFEIVEYYGNLTTVTNYILSSTNDDLELLFSYITAESVSNVKRANFHRITQLFKAFHLK